MIIERPDVPVNVGDRRPEFMDVDYAANGLTGSRFVELVQVTHDGRFVR